MLTLLLIAAVVADSIPEIINRNPNSTWVAIDYPASVITHAKLRSKIGARFTPHRVRPYRDSNKVPDTFDSRERWPDAILPVRDQGDCGSCWAFSIAETIGDRLGVLGCSRGDIAPEDLVSCDIFDDGCDGGFIDMAWDWCQENGLATEECIPYKAGEGVESPCPETCEDGSAIYRTPVDSYRYIDADNIQGEIYEYGPVSMGFIVYSDFMSYKSGVYVHQTGYIEGGHAVLIVGWGVEDDVPYWLVQNSWGTDWGENGFFKILRGSDHCECESNVTAGYPECID